MAPAPYGRHALFMPLIVPQSTWVTEIPPLVVVQATTMGTVVTVVKVQELAKTAQAPNSKATQLALSEDRTDVCIRPWCLEKDGVFMNGCSINGNWLSAALFSFHPCACTKDFSLICFANILLFGN